MARTRRLTREEVLALSRAEVRRLGRAKSFAQAKRGLARLFLALTCSTTKQRAELVRAPK